MQVRSLPQAYCQLHHQHLTTTPLHSNLSIKIWFWRGIPEMPSRCNIGTRKFLHLQQFLIGSLCLTFGGTPCPNFWEACREPFCDLANKLIHNSQRDQMTTFDPMSLPLLGPNRLPPDTSHAPALPLAIPVPPDNFGKGDIYIDDSIFVTPNINKPSNMLQKLFPLPSTPLQDHYPKMNHYLGKC